MAAGLALSHQAVGAKRAVQGQRVTAGARRCAAAPARTGRSARVVAGNANEGGLFAPIVVLVKNAVGVKPFNQIRGKAIALHSQVITEFCKSVGADAKTRQGLILKAKKNGGLLGFLA